MSKSRMSKRERHLAKERERKGRKARFPERRAPRRRFPAAVVESRESRVGSILALALRRIGVIR